MPVPISRVNPTAVRAMHKIHALSKKVEHLLVTKLRTISTKILINSFERLIKLFPFLLIIISS